MIYVLEGGKSEVGDKFGATVVIQAKMKMVWTRV